MSQRLLLTAVVLGITSVVTAGESSAADRNPAARRPSDSGVEGRAAASVSLPELAAKVLSDDAASAAAAVDGLRAAGPEGLAALLNAHRNLLEWQTAAVDREGNPQWDRLNSALDVVGAQRDCYTSRLYWYTDLNVATEVARRQHKPILLLRLLGKLTEEFSCANSRFFRTALYANHEISDYLRGHFVLCWQSVRPVPRVTIDFGDGRILERTLTGNSIHYLLNSEGRPFDALPGLYGPQAFLRELKLVEAGLQQATRLADSERNDFFVAFHQRQLQSIQQAWERDMEQLKISVSTKPSSPVAAVQQEAPRKRVVAAVRAGAVAMTKGLVELPVLRSMAFKQTERLRQAMTDDIWQKLGVLHQNDAVLDEASVVLIRRQNPAALDTEPGTASTSPSEETLTAMVRSFQSAMAIDTIRNEYDLHSHLHEWLATESNRNLDSLNERVYAELFLTPRTDPWLGMVVPDTYTGLQKGGRRE